MINKLLIANRGEIACRIIRSARQLGIQTVAVYSDADRHSLHVLNADESYPIGPAPALESYLSQGTILQVAKQAGVDAIHPGYGFLSENAGFAEACQNAGIIFVGPPAAAISSMGSKSEARTIMEKAGVPVLKGLQGADLSSHDLPAMIDALGYPVLLKPAAGGGGKGMKVVRNPGSLTDALASARREAMSAFGSDELIIEKYLEHTRHIEIQVFADQHGNCIHLMERDCSLQRRHQKVIEESPAPGISPSLREQLGEAAVNAARAVNYVGAGTVEFLLGDDQQFYFMEMNTRLQVEHPVTEMVTGIDLVEWQLQVADGHPLPLQQSEVVIKGHAIEARVYAEDPQQDFLPAAGRINCLRLPAESVHLRIDNGILEGEHIGVFYDPMLMKVISWHEDRDKAAAQLGRALEDLCIAGPKTNRDYLRTVLGLPEYRAAHLDTLFLDQHREALCQPVDRKTWLEIVATACHTLLETKSTGITSDQDSLVSSPWSTEHCWRLNSPSRSSIYLRLPSRLMRVDILRHSGRDQLTLTPPDGAEVRLMIDEVALMPDRTYVTDEQITVFHPLATMTMERPHAGMVGHTEEQGQIVAPMAGRIIAIPVAEGQQVKPGDILVVLEAMKMEHMLLAKEAGVVVKLPYQVGELVDEGTELAEIRVKADDD